MRRAEFDYQIERLKEVYGDNKYPIERTSALFDRFKDIDHDVFKKIVTTLIMSETYAPMLPKFEEAMRPYLNEIAEQKKARFEKQNEGIHCRLCNSSGAITAYEKEVNDFGYKGEFVFQCVCRFGRHHCPGFPKWSDFYAKKYERK